MGRPRYSAGKIDAAARASASRSPRHDTSDSAASTTNALINAASSAMALAAIWSPTQNVEVTPIDATTVATPAATSGIGSAHAAASRAYSTNARTSSSSATRKKIDDGANHTTATAIATSTAPLRTRVIDDCRLKTDDW